MDLAQFDGNSLGLPTAINGLQRCFLRQLGSLHISFWRMTCVAARFKEDARRRDAFASAAITHPMDFYRG